MIIFRNFGIVESAVGEKSVAADGGMAVWGVFKEDAVRSAVAEVHFNYWRLTEDPPLLRRVWNYLRRRSPLAGKDFVEVGVQLTSPSEVEKVFIYLPGPPDHWHLEDCGQRFADKDIAHGIFNVLLSATPQGPPGPKRVALTNFDETKFCRVHIFPETHGKIDGHHLSQEACDTGTCLTITRHALNEALGVPI
jgi:hypothetical protein